MKRHTGLADAYLYRDFSEALKRLKNALTRGPGYTLLLGESGTGKTTLLRTLEDGLDQRRFQVLYLCHGRPSPTGLSRVLAGTLHLPVRRSGAETSRSLAQTLRGLPTRLWVWVDEAQLLSEEALQELRLLAEADLKSPPLFGVVLSGLPELKERLLAPGLFSVWRRIATRVTLTGLVREEMAPFMAHGVGKEAAARFTADALSALFEQGRGVPGLVHAYGVECLRVCAPGPITPEGVAEALDGLETR